jgi:hypothetical protein
MTPRQVREWLAPNWVFRLFGWANPVLVVVGIPTIIFLISSIIAMLLSVFPLFVRNVMAYPIGIGFGLAAYGWYVDRFPRTIASVSTAFECAPGECERVVRKWGKWLINRNWLMAAVGALMGASMLPNLLNLWSSPNRAWWGQAWVQSDYQRGFPFFALYYGFTDSVLGGFLYGSGAVGLLGTVLALNELLQTPLKLSHSRKLMDICSLGLWLAVWTLVAFTFILPYKLLSTTPFSETGDWSSIGQATLALAAVDLAALALAFGVPIVAVRRSIINAKSAQMESLLAMKDSIYQTIQRLRRGDAEPGTPDTPVNQDAYDLRTRLRWALTQYYNMEELRTLCFDLGVDYENVQRDTKDGTVRELILYFERRQLARRLLDAILVDREIDWGRLPQPSILEQLESANQELELTNKMIAEIEAIPTWPVTTRRVVQATMFFALSVASGVGWTYFLNNRSLSISR